MLVAMFAGDYEDMQARVTHAVNKLDVLGPTGMRYKLRDCPLELHTVDPAVVGCCEPGNLRSTVKIIVSVGLKLCRYGVLRYANPVSIPLPHLGYTLETCCWVPLLFGLAGPFLLPLSRICMCCTSKNVVSSGPSWTEWLTGLMPDS